MSDSGSRIPIPQEYAAKLREAQATSSMHGERRIVTILFCDVTGSTSMAENLDPEDWAEIMHEAFNFLVAPVYRYEGTLARMMGDAILAFFGAPLAHEDDPQRAILAGLDILREIGPFCEKVRRDQGLEFNVRAGINTGSVVVGDIGSDLAMEYTAMGDAVNLASRMEQAAQPGTLLISEATYRLVAPLFEVDSLGPIEVKGKREPINAYQVLASKAEPGRLRGIEGLSSPMIGRLTELEKLRETLDLLRQGRGGIVCLIGEAGLGKSRMLEELRRGFESGPGRWMDTTGVSYDTTRPYSLFQHLFKTLCNITEQDSPETARQRIENLCSDFEPEVDAQAARAAELILTFHQDTDGTIQDGDARKRELFSSMLTAWRKPAVLPLVMVFDDLHWSDPASIELLQHLFQLTDEVPILFLCALRPYRQSTGWQVKQHAEATYPHRFTEVELEPLTEQESGELINSLLTVSELPTELRELILEKSEGNPFFVEELIRTLIDGGAIERDADGLHWRAAQGVNAISIPDNLQALLVSRIDRLDKEVRRTVQLASVIGRAFYYRVLEWIAEARDRLQKDLNVLQRVELIYEQARMPELEFAFKHDLTRDAAYESILRKERPRFHRQVGEAIEALFPDRLEEESHRLAYHWQQAKDDEKALKYFTLAGNMARRLSAYSEAITHYSHALEIAERIDASPAQFGFLYSRRGRIYELAGRFDEALENYRDLEQIGQRLEQPALQLTAANAQATIHAIPSARWDPDQAEQFAKQALELAQQIGDPRGEAKALWNLMLIENFTERDNELAIEYGERSLAIAREHNLTEEKAYALHDLARAYGQAGRYDEAAGLLEEARLLWEELGNSELLADNLTSSAYGATLQGKLELGIEMASRALELSRQTGNAWGQGYSTMALSVIHMERGELSDALLTSDASLSLAVEASFVGGASFLSTYMAWNLARLGIYQLATTKIQEAMQYADPRDPIRIWSLSVDAVIAGHQGDWTKAKQLSATEAPEMQSQVSQPEFAGFASYIQADFMLATGQHQDLIGTLEKRLLEFESVNARLFLPQMRLDLARARRALGEIEQARRILEQAQAEAQNMGLRLALVFIMLELVEVSDQLGDQAAADTYRTQAKELVGFLADHIEDPESRDSFTSQPRIMAVVGG